MKETFGERFTRLRKAKGMTQEDVAKQVTISPQAVSKWENDISSPDITMIGQLADILGVSVDELLGRETPAPEAPKEETPKAEASSGVYTSTQSSSSVDDDDEDEDDEDNEDAVIYSKTGDGKEQVYIGPKGIHVVDEDGTEVHIGGKELHVKDGKDEIHIDGKDFVITENGEIVKKIKRKSKLKQAEETLTPVLFGLALLAYLLMGFLWSGYGWSVGWTLFFVPPVIVSILTAIRKKRFCLFLYPLLVTCIYLTFGMLSSLTGFNGWSLWWVFITIPVYYLIFEPIDKSILK